VERQVNLFNLYFTRNLSLYLTICTCNQ